MMDIEAVRQKNEDTLMGLPNVVGIGIGEKEGRRVIKVLVACKVPISQLQPGEIIPEMLEGYEVDVDEIGAVEAQT